ncbi:hypothetical protein DFS34DRAFT_603124 [Phlyctochytrium arcticum]|nr:hypothetical protein DFS34DRAFT_603124 [Phlyctochytrium arcticum]
MELEAKNQSLLSRCEGTGTGPLAAIQAISPPEFQTIVNSTAHGSTQQSLEQICAAASAALFFRETALACKGGYLRNLQRKHGSNAAGPTNLSELIHETGFKRVVFTKMRADGFVAKDLDKLVRAGQFVVDVADVVGPGVLLLFQKDTHLSYSVLREMGSTAVRASPVLRGCQSMYSSELAAAATQKLWTQLGYEDKHRSGFQELVAKWERGPLTAS